MLLDNKTILVTGGAGAIGSTLVRSLFPRARLVVVLDDLSSGFEKLVPKQPNVAFVKGSVAESESLSEAFSGGIDIVYHLASHFANQNSVDHPQKDLMTNGLGTLNVLERCVQNRVELFVFASSSCVYGNVNGSSEEDGVQGQLDTPYAITKRLGEHYTDFFRDHFHLPTVIFRIFNSYGPGELPGKYRNVIPNFLKLAIEGKPLPVTGTGEETRTFNYVDNLIQAFVLAAETPAAVGETFNIGTDTETRIIDLATMINRIAQNHAGIEFVPRRSWDHTLRRRANIDKARRLLRYKPEDDLESGLRRTYDWLVQQAESQAPACDASL